MEIDCIVLRIHVRDVAFGVNVDRRVIAFIRKEGRNAGRSVRSIVASEFSKRKEFVPVVLLVRAVHPDILFQSLIHTLSLTVSFRVMSGSEMKFHGEEFAKSPEKPGDKLRASIGRDVRGNSVFGENVN